MEWDTAAGRILNAAGGIVTCETAHRLNMASWNALGQPIFYCGGAC